MRDRFQITDTVYGVLSVYAGIMTIFPSMVLAKPVDFDAVADPWQSDQPACTAPATTGLRAPPIRNNDEPA